MNLDVIINIISLCLFLGVAENWEGRRRYIQLSQGPLPGLIINPSGQGGILDVSCYYRGIALLDCSSRSQGRPCASVGGSKVIPKGYVVVHVEATNSTMTPGRQPFPTCSTRGIPETDLTPRPGWELLFRNHTLFRTHPYLPERIRRREVDGGRQYTAPPPFRLIFLFSPLNINNLALSFV